jgi:hypothetical protein
MLVLLGGLKMGSLLSVLLALAASGIALAQSNASGNLTIGKDKFDIRYAAATRVPDPFDKTRMDTRIVLTDKPVPEDLLGGGTARSRAEGHRGHNPGVQHQVFQQSPAAGAGADGCGRGRCIRQRICQSLSRPGGGNPVRRQAKDHGHGSAGPAGTDRYAAVSEMLKMVQAMTPANIRVLKVTEHGDRARIVARGSKEGQAQRGRIYLTRLNGKWVMAGETWGAE